VVFGYVLTVFGTKQVLSQNLERVWKLLEALNGGKIVVSVFLALYVKSLLGVKGVQAFSHRELQSLLY